VTNKTEMGNLNIQEIRNRVTLFFDNALCESEKNELLQQVESDPRCNEIFNKEQYCRNFIKNNITRPPVTTEFIDTIKNSINIR